MPINPISIAETVVFGVAFDPKNSARVARMDLNQLFASVGKLFDLLEERGVDYVLVGGIAMLSYVEGRNTQDIDLIIAEADVAKLPELRVEERNEQFARSCLGNLQVDLLFAERQPFRAVLESYVAKRPFSDREVPCATEEGLLLMKLYAIPSLYRQGHLSKVRIYEGDLAALLEDAARHRADRGQRQRTQHHQRRANWRLVMAQEEPRGAGVRHRDGLTREIKIGPLKL